MVADSCFRSFDINESENTEKEEAEALSVSKIIM